LVKSTTTQQHIEKCRMNSSKTTEIMLIYASWIVFWCLHTILSKHQSKKKIIAKITLNTISSVRRVLNSLALLRSLAKYFSTTSCEFTKKSFYFSSSIPSLIYFLIKILTDFRIVLKVIWDETNLCRDVSLFLTHISMRSWCLMRNNKNQFKLLIEIWFIWKFKQHVVSVMMSMSC
jgi:hypothetical protein